MGPEGSIIRAIWDASNWPFRLTELLFVACLVLKLIELMFRALALLLALVGRLAHLTKCPRCGVALYSVAARFCTRCGQVLVDSALLGPVSPYRAALGARRWRRTQVR